MSNIKLDLSKVKYVSSDDTHTVLQHHDGHEIRLLHKALAPDNQKQLQMLAEGGEVKKPVKEYNYGQNNAPAKPVTRKETGAGMSEGANKGQKTRGPVKSVGEAIDRLNPFKAEGGEVSGEEVPLDTALPSVEQIMASEPQPSIAEQTGEFVKTHVIDPTVRNATALYDTVTGAASGVKQAAGDFAQGAGISLPGNPMTEPTAPQPDPNAPAPGIAPEGLSAAPTQGIAPVMSSEQEVMNASGHQMQVDAQRGQQKALSDQAVANQKALEADAAARSDLMQKYQENLSHIDTEVNALKEDIANSHIDPNQYWSGDKDGNGGHSKIAAGIGMILAGFNPTNRPNAAIDFLQKQMDANIDSQKANLQSKHNLLGAFQKQYGDLNQATTMMRLTMNDQLQNQLGIAAAKAASPLAKAAADNAIGQLKQKYAVDAQKFATQRTIAQLTATVKQDPSKMDAYLNALEVADPAKAKEMRGRAVPGIGFANTPEDAKEIKEMGAGVKSAKAGISQLKELMKVPFKSVRPDTIAKANTIQQTLVGALRLPLTGPGAMSEGEREMLKDIIANPTKIFSLDSSNQIKLDNLASTLDQKFADAARSRGLNPPDAAADLPPAQQAFVKWARANPNDPRSKAVLQKLNLGQ